MPRRVSCQISDRSDGLFDVVATIEPDRVYRRDGFISLAQAEDWIEGLRVLMAALGAPVAQGQAVSHDLAPDVSTERGPTAGHLAPRC